MSLHRAALESLLRARQLDRTLVPAWPSPDPAGSAESIDEYAVAPTGITALDARLGGGIPRGQLSELAGAPSSGRTSLLLQMLAAATARQELVALIDVLDRLDVRLAEAAGIDLGRLLWIRGRVVTNPGVSRDRNPRAIEQAVNALSLVLRAGQFGLVAFDAADAPPGLLERLPFTTWLRLQRIVEGTETVCVLVVGGTHLARSAGGLTVQLGTRDPGSGIRFEGRLFKGLDARARVVRARARHHEEIRLRLSAACV